MTSRVDPVGALSPRDLDQWRELALGSATSHPFVHPAWVTGVAATATSRRAGTVALARSFRGTELVGVWPLQVTRRTASTSGRPLVDLGDPLVAAGPDEACEDLVAWAARSWRVLRLTELSAGVVSSLGASAEGRMRVTAAGGHALRGVGPLALDASARAAARRLTEVGVEIETLDGGSRLDAAIMDFEHLRLSSAWARGFWADIPPEARTAPHLTLLRTLGRSGADDFRVEVTRCHIEDLTVSAAVVITVPALTLVALKATDTRLGNRYSPGLSLDRHIIGHAGDRPVDYGRGDESYKARLGCVQVPAWDVVIRPVRWWP
jgi:Acetyltransferase (GNAT) domain